MGCGNCGTGASGKPGGCKGNGGCSTGGCNRMNVFDWLSALPLHDSAKPYPVIEVTFNKGSRKEFYRNNTSLIYEKGDWIAVEGVGGYDVGQVSLTGELVKLQMKKYGIDDPNALKRILRPANDTDIDLYNKSKEREPEVLIRSRAIARNLKLEMKLAEVELQADGKKATFFYTADQRVDFRELIKHYAGDFKVKVEMRQIGARQESAKVGGIGSCGRELCCATWLTDFKSVNTTAARYQNLSINQVKLSGQCGRLKCCLNYELDTYMDALRVFPDNADVLETAKGRAYLQKRDIFKNLMWYTFSDSNKQYPMMITRVKEILAMNKQGQKPDELQPVELELSSSKTGVKVDVGFVNDVGQITLRALERGNKKRKGGGANKPQQNAQGGQQRQGQPQGGQQQRPQQQKQGGQQRPQQQGQGQQQRPQQGQGQQRPQQQGQKQNQPQQRQGQQGGQQQQPKQGQQQGGGQQQPKQGQQQAGQQQRPQQGQQQRPQQQRPQQQRPQQQGQQQEGQQPKQNQPRPPRPPRPQGQGGGGGQQNRPSEPTPPQAAQ
ncbi:PSP1 domain-containing protein [Polluticoccus soli]|uniref:PSP1 domain-containing protein n=1 Tax=Polluticoccus soli TaxID=3034150 RepID=UPI0023E106C3|nr:regulatory iron-sulfur-containing complex subunit RicT [Flavipsychrobacter sp. JY13-12]